MKLSSAPARLTLAPVTPSATSLPPTLAGVAPGPTSVPPTAAPGTPSTTDLPPTPTAAPEARGWSEIVATNAGPQPRYDHSALLDPVRQQLVIFGGRDTETFGDTWVIDLTSRTWREVPAASPAARFGHGAAYDATHRGMLIVMGQGADFFNDVWAIERQPRSLFFCLAGRQKVAPARKHGVMNWDSWASGVTARGGAHSAPGGWHIRNGGRNDSRTVVEYLGSRRLGLAKLHLEVVSCLSDIRGPSAQ